MKIVFVIKPLNLCGGIERATILVANALAQAGHQINIVSFVGSDTTPFFEIDKRIQVYYLAPSQDKYPVVVRDIRRIVLLRKYYRRVQPDIIVLAGATRSIVNIPGAKGFKVIAWEHAAMSHHRFVPATRISRWLSARYSECVVALTQQDADVYKYKLGAKRTQVIPNPLTLVNPKPSPLQEKVVVSVGRLVSIKGFDLLLDAWKQVQHKDWTLRIVGGGKCAKKLQQKIDKENISRVEMIPQTNNVLEQYQRASIYALSSRSESFGLVLTEAMSVGLPIVSFDCGPGPKEIVEDGVNGVLVPAEDVSAMAHALDELMDQPVRRMEMGKAALEKVKKYEMDNILSLWENLLEQICRK